MYHGKHCLHHAWTMHLNEFLTIPRQQAIGVTRQPLRRQCRNGLSCLLTPHTSSFSE